MSEGHLPLSAHPGFCATSLDHLAEHLDSILSASIVKMPEKYLSIDAHAHRFDLSSTGLWSCSYHPPLALQFPEGPLLRVQFQRTGIGAMRAENHSVEVRSDQGAIHSGKAEVDFGDGFTQLAWRIPFGVLEGKLAALTGSSIADPLKFDPVLNLITPQARAMMRILEAILDVADAEIPVPTRLVRTELESALLVAFLCASSHNYRDLLERSVPAAAPWQVRRAESYIEANWDKPVTIEDIVTASGTSSRSIFRAFQHSRDYTPLQFLKQVRLRHAKRLLEDPCSDLSVTDIAMACGFSDVSNFSKDFSRTFRVPPSMVLRGKRREPAPSR